MAVVKSNQFAPLIKEAVVLDLGDISAQAEKLRMAAEAKAAEILADARAEAAQIIADGKTRGYDEGKAEGYQAGHDEGVEAGRLQALAESKDQLNEIAGAWTDTARLLDDRRETLEMQARQDVLRFAVQLAEKVVHRVVEVDDQVIVDQVNAALGFVLQPMDVTIRVHPEDEPVLAEALPKLLATFDHLEHVKLQTAPEVGRGGCVVGFGQGQVDATIATQLERIVQAIVPGDSAASQPAPDETA